MFTRVRHLWRRLRRRHPVAVGSAEARRDDVPATAARPVALVAAALTTPELRLAWQRSYLAMLDAPGSARRCELVLIRAHLLDELEQRDHDGFTRWLEAGADPGSYLASER